MAESQDLLITLRVDTSELDAAIKRYHVHTWVFDGDTMGQFIYHCDRHDPPEVRLVSATYGPS